MAFPKTDRVVCPSCGHWNMQGADSCEHCLADLTSLDVSESDLLLPLTETRLSRLKTIGPGGMVGEAVGLLREDASGAIVVVDQGAVVGIFTERDVLLKVAGQPERMDEPVSRYMTPDPVILRDTDTMAVAVNKMGLGGFRHIPLVHDGQLVAMVTARDVMQWVMMRYFDELPVMDT